MTYKANIEHYVIASEAKQSIHRVQKKGLSIEGS